MQPAETISVTLPPDLARSLRESVEAGEYASADDALRDAVRLWQHRRREDAERLDAIRARIRRSLDDPRPDLTSEEVEEHLEELFAQAERGARRV